MIKVFELNKNTGKIQIPAMKRLTDWTDSSKETIPGLDGFKQGNYSRNGQNQARKLFPDWMDSSKVTIPGMNGFEQGNYSKTGRI